MSWGFGSKLLAEILIEVLLSLKKMMIYFNNLLLFLSQVKQVLGIWSADKIELKIQILQAI